MSYVITDGKRYLTETAQIVGISYAFHWKKEESAVNFLSSRSSCPELYRFHVLDDSKLPVENVNNENAQQQTVAEITSEPVAEQKISPKNMSDPPIIPDNTVTESVLNELNTAFESLAIFRTFDIKRYLSKALSDIDSELSDLEHKIEFDSFSACEGYKLAKEIKVARQKRRRIKDSINKYTAISQDGNMEEISRTIEKLSKQMEQRTYSPKIRNDLFE